MSFLSNILDVLVISVIFYTLMLFLRKSKSTMIFSGIAIFVGVYLLARLFHLDLTLLVLRYFVGISAIIFAVVFQSEIRKYFELIGVIGTNQIKVNKNYKNGFEITELISSCVELSKNRWGGLIVLKGKDDIEGLIDGGVELFGKISEEIILSIFCPDSEGHDGAMIIDNNRITKFATHLPLSINFKEIGKHGTRHSAGLGLSEMCDAMCIVVSEEKGTISLCIDGKMKTLKEFDKLESELLKFYRSKYTQEDENVVAHIVHHNFWLKLTAILSALSMWIAYKN